MLKTDYKTSSPDITHCSGLACARQLARIWGARLAGRIGEINSISQGLLDALRELGVLDRQRSEKIWDDAPEAFSALADPTRMARCRQAVESTPWKPEGAFGQNFTTLATAFNLDEVDVAVLAFVSLYRRFDWFRAVADYSFEQGGLPYRSSCIACAAGLNENQTMTALSPAGRLFQTGLIEYSGEENWRKRYLPKLSDHLERALFAIPMPPGGLDLGCLRHAPPAQCQWRELELATPTLEVVGLAVKGAMRGDKPVPIRILLHGSPGVGKTQCARALGEALGLALYEVLETSPDSTPLMPSERVQGFRLGQATLTNQRDALILFDEADQVLSWSERASTRDRESWDKAWINDLLERTCVPSIWIVNRIAEIHPAILRRFHIVQELKSPPASVVSRIVERNTADLNIPQQWIETVARIEQVSPAMIESATAVGRLVAGSAPQSVKASISSVLDGHYRAQTGRRIALNEDQGKPLLPYRTDWLRTNPPADELLDRLKAWTGAGFRLVFHGPPGSGKTALARHLSANLERPLRVLSVSDIFSCWVGQTEKNIARAFEQAADENQILLLDEADGLLSNRGGAQHAWQVTQVNELLVQIEQFPGLLIAATNRLEELDPACMRRMDAKIAFDCLAPATVVAICQEMLGEVELTSYHRKRIERMSDLTLGDFGPFTRSVQALNQPITAETLLAALEQEVSLKPGASKHPIGF